MDDGEPDKIQFDVGDTETTVMLRYDDARAAPPLGEVVAAFPGTRETARERFTKWMLREARSAPFLTRGDLTAFLAHDDGARQRALAAFDALDVRVPPTPVSALPQQAASGAVPAAAAAASGAAQAEAAGAGRSSEAAAGADTAPGPSAAAALGTATAAVPTTTTTAAAATLGARPAHLIPSTAPPPALTSWQLGAALARGAVVPVRCATRLVALSAAAGGGRHFTTTVREDEKGRVDDCVICKATGAAVPGEAPADASACADSGCFVGCEFCIASAHSGCAGLVVAQAPAPSPLRQPDAQQHEQGDDRDGGGSSTSSSSSAAVAAAADTAPGTSAAGDALKRWHPGDWYVCPACMRQWLREDKLPFPLSPLWAEERRIAHAVIVEEGRPARAAGKPIRVTPDGHPAASAAGKGGGNTTYTAAATGRHTGGRTWTSIVLAKGVSQDDAAATVDAFTVRRYGGDALAAGRDLLNHPKRAEAYLRRYASEWGAVAAGDDGDAGGLAAQQYSRLVGLMDGVAPAEAPAGEGGTTAGGGKRRAPHPPSPTSSATSAASSPSLRRKQTGPPKRQRGREPSDDEGGGSSTAASATVGTRGDSASAPLHHTYSRQTLKRARRCAEVLAAPTVAGRLAALRRLQELDAQAAVKAAGAPKEVAAADAASAAHGAGGAGEGASEI